MNKIDSKPLLMESALSSSLSVTLELKSPTNTDAHVLMGLLQFFSDMSWALPMLPSIAFNHHHVSPWLVSANYHAGKYSPRLALSQHRCDRHAYDPKVVRLQKWPCSSSHHGSVLLLAAMAYFITQGRLSCPEGPGFPPHQGSTKDVKGKLSSSI